MVVEVEVVGGAPGRRGACRRDRSHSKWKRQENKPGCFSGNDAHVFFFITDRSAAICLCVRGGCGAVQWRQLSFLGPITGEDYDVAGSLLTSDSMYPR